MRGWLKGLGAAAGVFGAAGVALAAAGAHLAANPIVTTAAYFLLFHAAALLALCGVAKSRPKPGILVAGTLLGAGTVLFSGDLALRGLADLRLVHVTAPTGGVLMIGGWLVAAFTVPGCLVDPAAEPAGTAVIDYVNSPNQPSPGPKTSITTKICMRVAQMSRLVRRG